MTENWELERNDIEIDRELQVAYDNPYQIEAYLELWCNVREKFNIDFKEDELLDMYAFYNPFDDTVKSECIITYGDERGTKTTFDYEPTDAEKQLIKEMITEKIKSEYGQTPQEFCNSEIEEMSPVRLKNLQARLEKAKTIDREFGAKLEEYTSQYFNLANCIDGEKLYKVLQDHELAVVDEIIESAGEKIDIYRPLKDRRTDTYGDWELKILDDTYQPKGCELLVLKWYEGIVSTGGLINSLADYDLSDGTENQMGMGEIK